MTMLGRKGGVLKIAGVDAKRDDFSFGFLTERFSEPRLVLSLNKGAKFLITPFLMVSPFSLLNKRISQFEAKIVSKSSQRLLITRIKSGLCCSNHLPERHL